MTKLRKNEIIDKLGTKVTVSRKDLSTIFEEIQDLIVKELKSGNEINFPKVGTFKLVTRAARTGINPKTKEKIKISAKKACSFKASKNLKSSLN